MSHSHELLLNFAQRDTVVIIIKANNYEFLTRLANYYEEEWFVLGTADLSKKNRKNCEGRRVDLTQV